MKINFSELSRIYQDYLKDEEPAAGETCPSYERIAACVASDAPKKEAAAIIRHVSHCIRCATVLKEVLAISNAAEEAVAKIKPLAQNYKNSESLEKRARFAAPSKRLVHAVIAGIVVILVITLSVLSRMDKLDAYRGAVSQIIPLSPVNEAVHEKGVQFTWKSVPSADFYLVELSDEVMILLWRSDPVTTNSVRPPDEVVQKLIPGRTYYWSIVVISKKRAELRSPLTEFSIRK